MNPDEMFYSMMVMTTAAESADKAASIDSKTILTHCSLLILGGRDLTLFISISSFCTCLFACTINANQKIIAWPEHHDSDLKMD